MNMALLAHPEQLAQKEVLLLEQALNALRETTGMAGKIVLTEPMLEQGIRADALIELEIGGQPRQYLVEVKRIDRFAAIGQVKNQLDRFRQPGLLVANRVTADTADKCRELGVQFIDALGNAFLQGQDWFVLVKGQRTTTTTGTELDALAPPRAGTATAFRTIFALLCRPELLNASYREITKAAGVALGGIGWVFFDLNKRGLTTGDQKKGDRRILERRRMIEEWVTNYPIKLRPKLNAKRFQAENPDWWKRLDTERYEAQWGGEVAAERLTGHLKPNTVTLYMRPENMRQNLTKLVIDNKLRAAPNGDIEVLEAFWDFEPDGPADVVPPLLVYADLLATMDPRNFTVGQMILEQYINAPEAKA
jgi:hypothetical protein